VEIPLDAIGADTTVVIGANATVENPLTREEDDAWGAGAAFPGAKNRAMNFTYETCGLARNLCEVGPSSCPEGEVVHYDPSDSSCSCVAGPATTLSFPIRLDSARSAFFLSGNVFESSTALRDALGAPAPNGFEDELIDVVEQAFGVDACPGDITLAVGPGSGPVEAAGIGVTLDGFRFDNFLGLLQSSDPGGSKYAALIAAAEAQVCGQAIRDDACPYDDGTFALTCDVDLYTVVEDFGDGFRVPQSYDLRACPVTGPVVFRRAAGAGGFWT
jgi:hypothetical protein